MLQFYYLKFKKKCIVIAIEHTNGYFGIQIKHFWILSPILIIPEDVAYGKCEPSPRRQIFDERKLDASAIGTLCANVTCLASPPSLAAGARNLSPLGALSNA